MSGSPQCGVFPIDLFLAWLIITADRIASALDDWTINDIEKVTPTESNKQADEAPVIGMTLRQWEGTSEGTHAIPSEPISKDATAGSSEGGFELIPQISITTSTRPGLNLPCHIIPVSRNRRFCGRVDVLREISQKFFPHASTDISKDAEELNEAKTFSICGPGGMGKTQVAAEFVFLHKDRFDAIFWIFSDTSAKVFEGFCRIATELGLVDGDSADSHDGVVTRELVKGWLANPLKSGDPLDERLVDRANWLIVLDNADQMEEIEDILPLDGPGCVLLTSRDPLAKQFNYSEMTGLDLKPFEVEEGKELLAKLTGKPGDSAGVVELLGGLPLAMTQMAGIIVRRDLTFTEFTKAYTEEEGRREMLQLNLVPPGRRTGYEDTIASVWALESLKRGKALLEVLSFLDPDGILESILTTDLKSASLEKFPESLFAYQTARTELLQCSLITRTVDKIQVHRLVQDAARTKLDRSSARRVFFAAVVLVSSVWPFEAFGWRHGVSRWHVCEELFPQVQALRQHHSRLDISCNCSEEDTTFAKLLMDAGWYSHPIFIFPRKADKAAQVRT